MKAEYGFFHSFCHTKSISAFLNHPCCLHSALNDKQLLWNPLLDHKSIPEAFAIKCTGNNDLSKLQIIQGFSSFLSVTAVKSLTALQKSRQAAPLMETRTGSLTLGKGATEKSFV